MKKLRSYGPPILMIAPSVILIGIFVYYLIFGSIQMSMTDTHELAQAVGTRESHFVGLANYAKLLTTSSFLHSLRNLLQYTVAFIGGTMLFGFLWAWLLDRRSRAEGVFRSLYLFPFAISSIAAGVVWQWLLNSNTGDKASGLNRLLQYIGLGALQNGWTTNQKWGILGIAMPAIWQMAGYIMALFLAGFRGIPDEMREAARVDGASEWKIYRHVLFPQLSPIALSALIVLGHMSLKIFDLVVAITGGYTYYPTKVPAVDMAFYLNSGDYANASTVGVILLLIILVLIVPYLVHIAKEDK
ncbi:MAG: sugar ABC transporter permease [Propionibacteriaceae bacterium]|jgi:glucose/mannose transport system permease protein|nr:sugar ABC transporter permease [Propionibacteriaceae bacterium]